VLLAAGIALRRDLHRLRWALLAAAAAALVVGGTWYLRNFVDHGSPGWPFLSGPFGDPRPALLERVDASFLERPGDTISDVGADFYRDRIAGMLLVFAAGALSPLWVRRRSAAAFAGAALLAALLWANAPFTGTTGAPNFVGVPLNTVRYLGPALAAGAAALALSSRAGRRSAAFAAAVFALALGWNIVLYLGNPFLPSDLVLLGAVAAGALVAALAFAMLRPRRIWAAAGLVAAVATLAVAAGGWTERHRLSGEHDGGLIGGFSRQPDWSRGSAPISITPILYAAVAGDRLDHPLSLIPLGESCAHIRRRLRRGWVVIEVGDDPRAARCLRGEPVSFRDGGRRVWGGG
jgi:hypothetical protein